MKYSDILKNKHFQNLAALIRVPFRSEQWRKDHPDVAFWTLLEEINDVKTAEMFESNRTEFVNRFLILLLAASDSRLSYTRDDLRWFIEAMDGEHALVTVSMLLAYASAPEELITAAEAARITGTSESGWRNKAAAGEIPGAVKRGGVWFVPSRLVEPEESQK
jgi:hypothetical protein